IARLGVEVDLKGHSFPATDPNNICNRGRRGVGVQVELTLGLRLDGPRDAVSAAIRDSPGCLRLSHINRPADRWMLTLDFRHVRRNILQSLARISSGEAA
ncbi:MAG TPA: poly-gamma-glutamate hydrolase family protein, partial [Methylophilaceae bacterium]